MNADTPHWTHSSPSGLNRQRGSGLSDTRLLAGSHAAGSFCLVTDADGMSVVGLGWTAGCSDVLTGHTPVTVSPLEMRRIHLDGSISCRGSRCSGMGRRAIRFHTVCPFILMRETCALSGGMSTGISSKGPFWLLFLSAV